jgi:hypothetical protein
MIKVLNLEQKCDPSHAMPGLQAHSFVRAVSWQTLFSGFKYAQYNAPSFRSFHSSNGTADMDPVRSLEYDIIPRRRRSFFFKRIKQFRAFWPEYMGGRIVSRMPPLQRIGAPAVTDPLYRDNRWQPPVECLESKASWIYLTGYRGWPECTPQVFSRGRGSSWEYIRFCSGRLASREPKSGKWIE